MITITKQKGRYEKIALMVIAADGESNVFLIYGDWQNPPQPSPKKLEVAVCDEAEIERLWEAGLIEI